MVRKEIKGIIQSQWCIVFSLYVSRLQHRLNSPNLSIYLEEVMKQVREILVKIELMITGDRKARIGNLQMHLNHIFLMSHKSNRRSYKDMRAGTIERRS
jgi:hypothetical protein